MSARRRGGAGLLLGLLLCLILAPAALAADCPKTTLGDVENEVMCIVCGTPLALATEAPQAERERALIRREISECRSKDQVKDELVAQYGRRVLATPDQKGFNLAVYLVPALAVLFGGGGVAFAALQWRRSRRDGPAEAGPPSATATADGKRLQADLDSYEL